MSVDVAARLGEVRARIVAACEAAGRDPDEVTLVAVSKTHPEAAIRAAYEAGQRDFGENYAQDLRDKARALADLDLRWHFIGRLQRNKCKYVAPVTTLVHDLERVEVAQALVARAEGEVHALAAVHIGGEATKGGLEPEALAEGIDALDAVQGLTVDGLMCIPPPSDTPEGSLRWFEQLRELRDAVRTPARPLPILSMGMSHDFEVAVRAGATHVRVGTAIFGPRTR